MAGIKKNRTFHPVNIALLTVSDTRSEADDKSGDILAELVVGSGHNVAARAIVIDEQSQIVDRLKDWINDENIDVVIATGGTGVTGRDITPEAFAQVYDKEIPGFGELFRMLSYEAIGTSTMQSRTTGGVAGEPISSPCRVRPAPAAMAGKKSCVGNWIPAIVPAIW